METITISMERFKDLLHKEFVYDMKKKDLERDEQRGGYICATDRLMFDIPEKPEGEPEPPAADEF